MTNKEEQINLITKRYSILEKVPREERLNVFNRSKKSPLLWATLIVLLAIWLYFFGVELIRLSGNLYDPNEVLIMKIVSAFKKLFFPVFVPAMILFTIVWSVQANIIKKIVQKEYIK